MAYRKKDEHLLLLISKAPWWVGMLIAAISFVILRWMLPAMFGRDAIGRMLATFSVSLSLWISLAFVLAGIVSALRQLFSSRKERRYNEARDVPTSPAGWGRVNIEPTRHEAQVATVTAKPTVPASSAGWGSLNTEPTRYEAQVLHVAEKPTAFTLSLLRELDWKRFEEVSAELFRALGFRAETLTHGPDGGIDVKLYKPDGSLPVAIVQCKAWSTRLVGIKPLREMLGVMTHEKIAEGIFLVTGNFTLEALDFAKANHIDTVDGERYLEMIGKLSDEAQKRLLHLATYGDYRTPSCPSCGVKLTRRESERGDFWGCINYPKCRYKLNSAMHG